MMRIQYSEGINFDWLDGWKRLEKWRPTCSAYMYNSKTDKKFGTIASVFEFNIDLHYMCLSS